jgi:hypothetical protein
MATTTAEHAADTEYLVRKAMTTGYQFFSLLTPPAYTAFILARRGRGAFTANRLLRATWLGGFVGGPSLVSSVSDCFDLNPRWSWLRRLSVCTICIFE